MRSSLVPHAVLLMHPRTMKYAPSWFHSIAKEPSVKADLAIYQLSSAWSF